MFLSCVVSQLPTEALIGDSNSVCLSSYTFTFRYMCVSWSVSMEITSFHKVSMAK